MGLSFHYSGSIANPEFLPQLIDEVRDIATVYNWEYKEYEREFPKDSVGQAEYNQYIYGISFTPPQCETISICFLSNGRMSSHAHLLFYGKTDEQPESDYLYMLSVKTQFASAVLHQSIIQLFRHLNKKYFANFTLSDEGSYWETNDIELLKTNFKRNSDLINGFSSAIEAIPMLPDETIEAYFERLMNLIKPGEK
jgi:hypothetical protein